MKKDYTYAVTRVRSLEMSLLNQAAVEQLISCESLQTAMRLLTDRGWGAEPDETPEKLLGTEEKKAWEAVSELSGEREAFRIFAIADDYQNLKAAIKLAYTRQQMEPGRVFLSFGMLDIQALTEAAKTRDYSALPEFMALAACDAQEVLLQTGDGQLCDVILDRAALEEIDRAGKSAEDEVMRAYASLAVFKGTVKIAVRCGESKKSRDFLERALPESGVLDRAELIRAAGGGKKGVAEYLAGTRYDGAAAELLKSTAAFERWCDSRLIEEIRPQKYNPFSIGPLAAYLIARKNELGCVRLILSAKQNGLPESAVRERVREMYG